MKLLVFLCRAWRWTRRTLQVSVHPSFTKSFAVVFSSVHRSDLMPRRVIGCSSFRSQKKKPPDPSRGEDNDPNKLWCICRQPEDGKFMIQCDECGEWLHGECVGLLSSQGLRMEECGERYLCPLCNPQTRLPIPDVNQSATFVWSSGLASSEFLSWLQL